MNPNAADSDKAPSLLTPWDSIDPNEPAAVGVLEAPHDWIDEPQVTVYRVEEWEQAPALQRRVIAAESPAPGISETRAIEESAVVSDAVARGERDASFEISPTAGDPLVEAAQKRADFDPEGSLRFDEEFNCGNASDEALNASARGKVVAPQADISPQYEVAAPAAELISASDPFPDIAFDIQAAGDVVSEMGVLPVARDPAAIAHETVAAPSEAAAVPSPELFVDSPEMLDALSESLAPISDITQVVGETPVEPAAVIELKSFFASPAVDHVMDSDLSQTTQRESEARPVEVEEPLSEAPAEESFAQAIDDADVPADEPALVEPEAVDPEPQPVWEDPEMEEEPAPLLTGATWTIPLLCAGIGLIACCVVIPQADANRRLAYEKQVLQMDLESVQKQVAVNDEFLKKVVDDPSLSERLAQRQLKRVRKGQHVLQLKDEKQEMSPFQIVNVPPPAALPPYTPAGGVIASLCYDARTRLYTMGAAMVMIACGLVLGASPVRRPAA